MPVETAQVSAVVIEVGDPETETDDIKKAQLKTKSQSSEWLTFIMLSFFHLDSCLYWSMV